MTVNFENVSRIIRDAARRSPYSNCMKSVEEIEKGIANGNIEVIHDTNPVITVENRRDFSQLYYFFDRALGEPLVSCPEMDWGTIHERIAGYNPLYADITVRGDFEYQGSVFEKLGLKPFRTYLRMSCGNSGKKYPELIEPQTANIDDIDRIQALLRGESTFDVMSDHLPETDELWRLLLGGGVLKIELDGELAGVYIFEDVGVKTCGRALCVAVKYQNNVVGYALVASYINRHAEAYKTFEIWLNQINSRSYRLHKKLGFKEDGLKNYIFKI